MAVCPVCTSQSHVHTRAGGFEYFSCSGCGILHVENAVLREIDAGMQIVKYSPEYWEMELFAAEERSRSVGVIRLAEAIFLCRRPVQSVIDIGTGTGRLLEQFERLLPNNSKHIWGVELFPPPIHQRTESSQYVVGTVSSMSPRIFDAGLCMEVVEHLTPLMVHGMLTEIANRSNEGACYVVNTGLADFVRNEDPGYLDPVKRGHIVAWTVAAFNILGKPLGLTATSLPGRSWAFLLEKTVNAQDIESRLYAPLIENMQFLADGKQGMSLLSTAAAEAARGYFYQHQMLERTAWALSLKSELDGMRNV
jgi:hypothetical protein